MFVNIDSFYSSLLVRMVFYIQRDSYECPDVLCLVLMDWFEKKWGLKFPIKGRGLGSLETLNFAIILF